MKIGSRLLRFRTPLARNHHRRDEGRLRARRAPCSMSDERRSGEGTGFWFLSWPSRPVPCRPRTWQIS